MQEIRRRFSIKKVGHCGTLDPAASGLLVILLGRATKLSERLNLPAEQVRQLYEKDENALRQLRYRMKEDRTIEYVLGQVKVSNG